MTLSALLQTLVFKYSARYTSLYVLRTHDLQNRLSLVLGFALKLLVR